MTTGAFLMAETEDPPKKTSDLRLRLASAVVLGPLILLITYFGGLAYNLAMLAAAMLFLWEWCSITGTQRFSVVRVIGEVTLLAVAALFVAGLPETGLAVLLGGALLAFASLYFPFTHRVRWLASFRKRAPTQSWVTKRFQP